MADNSTATAGAPVFFYDLYRCVGSTMRLKRSQKNPRSPDRLVTNICHQIGFRKLDHE